MDVVRRELQGKHPRELDHGAFACCVRRLALHSDEAEHGGHVYDLSRAFGTISSPKALEQ